MAVVVGGAVLIGGCGGGGSNGDAAATRSTTVPSSLISLKFVNEANRVCHREGATRTQEMANFEDSYGRYGKGLGTEAIVGAAIPSLQSELSALQEVHAPPWLAKKDEKLLAEYARGLEEVEEDPASLTRAGAFKGFDEWAKKLILTDCAGSLVPITKAEFLKRGNAICAKGGREIKRGFARFEQEHQITKHDKPSQAQREAAAKEIVIPGVRKQLEELWALGAPSGEDTPVKEILGSVEVVLERAEQHPRVLASKGEGPFAEADQLARKYGLVECGAWSGEQG